VGRNEFSTYYLTSVIFPIQSSAKIPYIISIKGDTMSRNMNILNALAIALTVSIFASMAYYVIKF